MLHMPDGTAIGERLPANGWAVGDAGYAWLKAWALSLGARTACEFGPGRSTQALLEAGCSVVSYEPDARFASEMRRRFSGLPVDVRDYREHALDAGGYDLAFVDSPRGLGALPRIEPLRWAFSHGVRVCALHDARRPGERRTVAALVRELGVRHAYHDVDTGISVLEAVR